MTEPRSEDILDVLTEINEEIEAEDSLEAAGADHRVIGVFRGELFERRRDEIVNRAEFHHRFNTALNELDQIARNRKKRRRLRRP